MSSKHIKSSELPISDDGVIYHLGLRAEEICKNIILVGDPGRTYQVANYFDNGILFEKKNREFVTVAGTYKNTPITVIGTGIGPDNIEITAIELHALNEYNYKTGIWKKKFSPLNILRIGTAGCPQKNIPVGSLAISEYAIGLDNVGTYYPWKSRDKFGKQLIKALNQTSISKINPYVSKATPEAVKALTIGCQKIGLKKEQERGFYVGITCSAPSFYASQGRRIGRLKKILIPDLQKILEKININGKRIINNEMESSAMFRILGEILNYRVGTICAVLANRGKQEFVEPEEYLNSTNRAIRAGLEAIKILVRD